MRRLQPPDPPAPGQTGLRVPGLRADHPQGDSDDDDDYDNDDDHPQGVPHPGGLPLPPLIPGENGTVSTS